MKDIVLFGVQWAWKWTQASKILEYFWEDCKYFEAWNILRALKSKPNALWEYVSNTIDEWNMVNDDFISSLFYAFITTLKDSDFMLLDWYPRKSLQMNHFLDKMNEKNRDFIALFLDLSEDVAIKRLSSRRICNDCWKVNSSLVSSTCLNCWSQDLIQREDDYPDAITKRISLYKDETQPVIDHFKSLWNFVSIDANWTEDEVFERILKNIS